MANGDDSDVSDSISESVKLKDLPSAVPRELPVDPSQAPQTTQTPSQQKDANKDLTKDDHADPLAQETYKHFEVNRKRADDAQKTLETIQGEIDRLNQELSAYKAPTPPTLRPYPQYPGLMGGQQGGSPTAEQQDKQGNIGTIMMQVASIIAIGSAVFGRHRNPYSQIVQQSAIGGFLNGLAQGRKDIAADQLQNWNKAVELTDKLNKEDIEDYHNVLSNNRLTMADQHLLLADIASARQDVRMYNAATTKDLNEYFKILSDQSKARAAWVKSQLDANTRAVNKFLESTQGLSWSQDFKLKFKNSGIDPYKSHDDLLKAFEMYPISKWQADRKASGSVDTEDETDKTGATTGGGTNENPIMIQEPEGSAQDAAINNLPSGTVFMVPGDATKYRKR